MTKYRSIKLVWLLLLAGVAVQANEELTCPSYIAVSQKETTPPPGWDVTTQSKEAILHNVSGVNFYDGPPSELVRLTPSDGKMVGNRSSATWKLYKKRNSGQGFWIECTYTYTHVVLSKRMPDSIKECSTYSEKYSTPKIKNEYAFDRMECK